MTTATMSAPAEASPTTAVSRPVLNFWLFGAPYIATTIYFFVMIKDDSRIYAPIFPIAIVLIAATAFTLIDRRLPALNHDVILFMLIYLVLGAISVGLSQNVDSFALRKIALPLIGMAPAAFRFYTTPRQFAAFLVALFVAALIYTTQTSDLIGGGFLSTDSPYESILGATFGGITVWLVASSRYTLATLAYLACILFFKRNAIVMAFVVSMAIVAIQIFRQRDNVRLFRRILYVAVPVATLLALYLSRIFGYIAANLVRGYNAEYISVGRAPIYDFIIGEYERSTIREQVLGHGAGMVEYIVATERSLNAGLLLPHDEYLSWLYDFGIVGLIILLVFFARIGRSGIPAIAVLLFMTLAMTAENFFLISFNCLAIFALCSTRMVDTRAAAP